MKKTTEIKKRALHVKIETVRKLSETELAGIPGGGSTGNSDLAPRQTICLACAF
jgi:hypothetical protein